MAPGKDGSGGTLQAPLVAREGQGAPAGPPGLHESALSSIVGLKLYKDAPQWLRADYVPFLLLYTLVVNWTLKHVMHGEWWAIKVGFQLALGVAVLSVLVRLLCHWIVAVRCFCRFSVAPSLADATVVRVFPAEHAGAEDVVPLERNAIPHAGTEVAFSFRKQRFLLDPADGPAGAFRPLPYPTRLPLSKYIAHRGLAGDAAVATAAAVFGRNEFVVPIPTFVELLKEQMTAPFFIFQIFCVGLWMLDEYWYYSLFTLFMLVAFECTVVMQRQRNLRELRGLQSPRQHIHAFRSHRWIRIPGEAILPGDLISVVRPAHDAKPTDDANGRTVAAPGAGGRRAAAPAEEAVFPCDALLLAGSVVAEEAVLTGESIPQTKDPLDPKGKPRGPDGTEAHLSVHADKAHMIFGGTKVLQHSPPAGAGSGVAGVPPPPDGGCPAVALRTGFGTAQGRLIRTMLYSTDRVTANNWEAFFFILFLLVFAISASAYVLYFGLKQDRSRYKLLLDCVIIVTSVVPPELPMELTIAVNASLVALLRRRVFCTEPFRIPFAGRVDVCCFDKTGTLTSDDMRFLGVACAGAGAAEKGGTLITDPRAMPPGAVTALLVCNSVTEVDGEAVGDPLEKAALERLGWRAAGNAVTPAASASAPAPPPWRILSRNAFSSDLRRMSTIAEQRGAAGARIVAAKGAPESIRALLRTVPAGYDAAHAHWASQGTRVLALASKALPADADLAAYARADAESGLEFCGFALFETPVKEGSAPALELLAASSQALVMITGDAPLTACHVARETGIVARPVLVLGVSGEAGGGESASAGAKAAAAMPDSAFAWTAPDRSVVVPFSRKPGAAAQVAEQYDLCVTGDGLSHAAAVGVADEVIAQAQVFARTTPEQKEIIVRSLKSSGSTVLMCGDGTNDVGALKAADVGVALLAPPTKKPQQDGAPPDRAPGTGPTGLPLPDGVTCQPVAGAAAPGAPSEELVFTLETESGARMELVLPEGLNGGKGTQMYVDVIKRAMRGRAGGVPQVPKQVVGWATMLDKMEAEGGMDGAPMVRPGDASMAAPFTARAPDVLPCTDVLRQGRCTLVTTVVMFKVLGCLCLNSAFSLSVLYLEGIKLGDYQATIQGMLQAGMFFFLSQAKPLQRLSRERPHPHILSPYVFVSLIGQFAVQLTFLILAYLWARPTDPADKLPIDGDFKPNLVNSVCFLAQTMAMATTFATNYVGKPFNTPLAENKGFYYGLVAVAGLYVGMVLDLAPPLRDSLELVPIPAHLQDRMMVGGVLVFGLCLGIERGCRRVFAAPPAPHLRRRAEQLASHALRDADEGKKDR
ncbi:unnamed protein product [Pedinophyceae sp. YPF-701]|nr:unnamed protein product [Pedinophyceae sp. YPF-701]